MRRLSTMRNIFRIKHERSTSMNLKADCTYSRKFSFPRSARYSGYLSFFMKEKMEQDTRVRSAQNAAHLGFQYLLRKHCLKFSAQNEKKNVVISFRCKSTITAPKMSWMEHLVRYHANPVFFYLEEIVVLGQMLTRNVFYVSIFNIILHESTQVYLDSLDVIYSSTGQQRFSVIWFITYWSAALSISINDILKWNYFEPYTEFLHYTVEL